MTLQMWILCLSLLGLSSALVCPDGGVCDDRNTCCQNNQGGFGCCLLPHAVCCSDHLHCCFQGTVCDLVQRKCVNESVSLPWTTRLPTNQTPLIPQLSEGMKAVICPDQESECPDETTCCQLPDSSWGCCPLAKAVCCEDKRHCCPEGTKCDLIHSKCVPASPESFPVTKSFPMLEKLPARRRATNPVSSVGSVTCPGGKSICPDGYTCCQLTSGDYGCCPFPEAMCCSDHLHCCPSNTICDLEHSVCRTGGSHVPMMRKITAVPNDIVCPDQKSVCPDQTTCCQMTNGTYGCCPMPKAVCCSDHIHCCPAGTQCDLIHSTCMSTQQEQTSTVLKTIAAAGMKPTASSRVHAVPCNDSVACADGSTCCKSPGGEWACCPLQKAVCCEDHMHCCPHGTVCNLEASTCDDPTGNAVLPWVRKTPTFPIHTDNNKCDKSMSCPGKSTCCKTPTGAWACCPLPEAVCCSDHIHCCPHGTVCNLAAETCDDPSGLSPSVRWMDKVSAVQSKDEKCDKQTMCPGGTTCCKKNSGQWACCPLPQAVCCNDHEHCCPKGYKCNVAEQTCDKPGHLSLPWLQKVPALQTRSGPALQTRSGPAPETQSGPTPETQSGPALQTRSGPALQTWSGSAPETRSGPALQTQSGPAGSGPVRPDRNMCDAQTSCPRDTTCCFMDQTHRWGCCPLPNAVCCKDGNHCCPAGHTCEADRSSCSQGLQVTPWFSKLSAETEPSSNDVKCDDKSSCASGTTCCKLPTGDWGCCPLVKAVCCADREHCCPQGYTCNMQTGTCEKKYDDGLIHPPPQSTVVRSELRDVEDQQDVPCDETGEFSCPKKDTCCKVSDNEWSCCPSSKAVCCSDSNHCCPVGFSCDLKAGGCSLLSWDSLLEHRKKTNSGPGTL